MLKLFFLFFLLLSKLAFAGSYQFSVKNPEANFYIDKSSIKRSGSNVELWILMDYIYGKTNKKGEQYFSMENRVAIDCRNYTITMKYLKVYAGHMRAGKVLAKGAANDLRPIPRGSSLEIILNQVCN
jgi:hypothetical protein